MTSQRSNLALLLFLSASPLLHPHLFTHATSTSPPAKHPRILTLPDYEDDNMDDQKAITPAKIPDLHQEVKPCQLDPCLENQEPCFNLLRRTGCTCPGRSGDNEPPREPRIKGLLPVSEGENRGMVEIQWCAPSSEVSGYRVLVEGNEEDTLEFGEASRRGFLRSLEVGTKVCVEAVNKAGNSVPSEFSCKRYEPPVSSDNQMLIGVIGGGIAVLLLLIIATVILWKHHMHKKANRDSNDGLRNPSYSIEGNLWSISAQTICLILNDTKEALWPCYPRGWWW